MYVSLCFFLFLTCLFSVLYGSLESVWLVFSKFLTIRPSFERNCLILFSHVFLNILFPFNKFYGRNFVRIYCFQITKWNSETKLDLRISPLYRSQWPHCLWRRSAAARLLRLWVRIPPVAWMFVCCECRVLSGRGLCDELITRPEESCRLWCVVVCDLENLVNEEAMTRVGSQRHKKIAFMFLFHAFPHREYFYLLHSLGLHFLLCSSSVYNCECASELDIFRLVLFEYSSIYSPF